MNNIKTFKKSGDEQILYRFEATGTGTEYFELVFSAKRLIIAKTGGRPFLKVSELVHAIAESSKKVAELQSFSMEEILNDNAENTSIAYSDVSSIEMNKPGFFGGGANENPSKWNQETI